MKLLRLIALLLAMTSLPAAGERLTIFGDDAYPPVVFLNEGKPSGILPSILERISTLTGDNYDIQLFPWKRAYELSTRGEGGVIGISFNQERAKLFDFSDAIYDDDIQIVTLAGHTFPYAKLEDLKGKVIGGVIGASYGDAVDQAIAAGLFTVERDLGQSGRLRKLLAGRLDAAFIGNGRAGLSMAINSHPELQANKEKFTVLPVPLTRDPLYLAFAKSINKSAALERFDAALKKLRRNGELARLIATAK